MKNSTGGFTLIELLVVITIIAILTSLGLSVYQSVYKGGRDAKRQSDLKLIQSALEQYHADQKYYPFSITPGSPLSFDTKTYLTRVPSDPTRSPDYSYVASGSNCDAPTPQNCSNYCLYAKIEVATITSDPGCTPSPPYNYGVTKP